MQTHFIYFFYRLIQVVASPLLVVYFLMRGLRDRRYFYRLWERLGVLPHAFQGTASGAIWLHAVSVGEVLTAGRLLRRLRERYPARRLYVSSTTLAGRALAEEKLQDVVDGVFYAPIDHCFAIRGALRRLRPSVVIIFETEIWPNWYREVKRTGAGLLVVNGRISDRAVPRYRRLRWFFRTALRFPDRILAQDEVAARRYIELGAPPEKVWNAGNLKYDFDSAGQQPPDDIATLICESNPAAIWIAASTMPPAGEGDIDEDEVVVAAFRRLAARHAGLLGILVPRRPGRFDQAAARLRDAGVPYIRRSGLEPGQRVRLPGVLLLDSIGELSSLFPLADVVFMGGSLNRRGGHNILEPAFCGKPVIVGPHMENFTEIDAEFRAGRALATISSPAELAGAVDGLLSDPARRRRIGNRAKQLAETRRGAAVRAEQEVCRISRQTLVKPMRLPIVWLALWPLSQIWRLGTRLHRTRELARQRRLETPVISVGGVSMGGAGKTPFTLHLTRIIAENGLQPAILTRGYRRRVPEKSTVIPAGSFARTSLTGDEAQILLRAGLAHLGIGADRYATGRQVEESLEPDVIILDDAFQHWRLARDLDIVLIDALNPLGGGELFPLGWLREPPDALARADVLLITRVGPGSPVEGIEARLREYNATAPIFRSRVEPVRWIDAASGEVTGPGALSQRTIGAFCGLANPATFWRSLAGLHCRPVACWRFHDHHHYAPRELQRMADHARAAGAEMLVTTQKDFVNLPPNAAQIVAPLGLRWLEIDTVVDDEERLVRLIMERLGNHPKEKSRGASG